VKTLMFSIFFIQKHEKILLIMGRYVLLYVTYIFISNI
jgi:hypothetical protein